MSRSAIDRRRRSSRPEAKLALIFGGLLAVVLATSAGLAQSSIPPATSNGAIATDSPLSDPAIRTRLESLPARGSSAEIFRTSQGLAAVAVANGRWMPEPGQARLPDALARDRAIRAAAVLAKSEIGKLIRSSVEVESWLKESLERTESREVIVVTLGRTMLAGVRRWRVNAEPADGGWTARVWLWTSASRDPGAVSPEGSLRFDTQSAAAEGILDRVGEGLADRGTLTVLVGPRGAEHIMTLGIAIGTGRDAERVAILKAEAEVVRARAATVEGKDRLEQSETIEDPLSEGGSRSVLSERFSRERTERANGIFRRGGKAVRTDGEVTYVVVWPEG